MPTNFVVSGSFKNARLVNSVPVEAEIQPEDCSRHSLRAGLATSALKGGVSTNKVRAQTGHASDVMLARHV